MSKTTSIYSSLAALLTLAFGLGTLVLTGIGIYYSVAYNWDVADAAMTAHRTFDAFCAGLPWEIASLVSFSLALYTGRNV
jgi:hypothetical protein